MPPINTQKGYCHPYAPRKGYSHPFLINLIDTQKATVTHKSGVSNFQRLNCKTSGTVFTLLLPPVVGNEEIVNLSKDSIRYSLILFELNLDIVASFPVTTSAAKASAKMPQSYPFFCC